MINLNQLRAFYCVAKNLSYTKAAKELFITQPAVTAQVKHFEDISDLKFFKKKGRGICLTEDGKIVYQHAKQLFEVEGQIEKTLDDLKSLKQGVLLIGSTRTYARYLMPHLMRHFHEKFPEIKIILDEGSSFDMSKELLAMKKELVIVANVNDSAAIKYIPFSEEEIIPILSLDHPLIAKGSLSEESCSQEPIIMREIGSGTRKAIDGFLKQHKCIPNILIETANNEFIKQLVAQGYGISFMVKEAVMEDLKANRLATIPFHHGKIYLTANIAYLKKQPLGLTAAAFLEVMDEFVMGSYPVKGIRNLLPGNE